MEILVSLIILLSLLGIIIFIAIDERKYRG